MSRILTIAKKIIISIVLSITSITLCMENNYKPASFDCIFNLQTKSRELMGYFFGFKEIENKKCFFLKVQPKTFTITNENSNNFYELETGDNFNKEELAVGKKKFIKTIFNQNEVNVILNDKFNYSPIAPLFSLCNHQNEKKKDEHLGGVDFLKEGENGKYTIFFPYMFSQKNNSDYVVCFSIQQTDDNNAYFIDEINNKLKNRSIVIIPKDYWGDTTKNSDEIEKSKQRKLENRNYFQRIGRNKIIGGGFFALFAFASLRDIYNYKKHSSGALYSLKKRINAYINKK